MACDERVRAISKRLKDVLHRLTVLEGPYPTSAAPDACLGRLAQDYFINEDHTQPAQLAADAAVADQASMQQGMESASVSSAEASPTQLRLAQELESKGVSLHSFKRMPHDYYQCAHVPTGGERLHT